MKRLFFVLLILVFALSGCVVREPDISFRIDRIKLTDNSGIGFENYVNFSFYIDRPKLGLSQPENSEGLLTADLPTELQPKVLYADGEMCDAPRFPHSCNIIVSGDEIEKGGGLFEIKVDFEDGTSFSRSLSVDYPDLLGVPEIVEPSESVGQGDLLALKFEDVGADSYEVDVNLCEKYGNDGINPCLDGISYLLVRGDDGLYVENADEVSVPEVRLEEGFVSLSSNFPLVFEDSVEFNVKAIKRDIEADVEMVSESVDYKSIISEPTA